MGLRGTHSHTEEGFEGERLLALGLRGLRGLWEKIVVLFNKRCAQCSKAPAYSTRDHHPSTFPPFLQICSQTGIARATGFTTATAATA